MRPLEGLRVLDFSRILSGPYATMLLADMGADVVKVEPPEGDPARGMPPHFHGGESVYFLSVNRSKRSIALDLGRPEGRAVALDLARWADVAIENFRPGVADRLGVDGVTLRAANPKLVTCAITGWGDGGPYAARPAFDLMAQSVGGALALTGHAGAPPARMGVSICDHVSGIFAATGILAALRERDRTGKGGAVDLSLLGTMLSLLTYEAAFHLHSGVVPPPVGTGHTTAVPYGAFEAKDGKWIALDGHNQKHFPLLVGALGLASLADDVRFQDREGRRTNRALLDRRIADAVRTRDRDEWVKVLCAAGVPAAPVNRFDEVFVDPQVVHEALVVDVPGPGGPWRATASPWRFDGEPATYRAAPKLGQHTREVLGEVGYEAARIDALLASGAAGSAE